MRTPRLFAASLVLVVSSVASAQKITTPKEEFGKSFGDDYFLANYRQISAYWQKLARESDRMRLVDIGKTAEGRTQYMAIVSSPANLARLDRYREISARLAKAEGLTDAQARALAKEGKAVVWIDGGLHATETLGAQQLAEMVYQMVSRTDEETLRILDDVVTLFVHANPDGNDLVADWYMRNPDTLQRSTADLPRLYQKYIGHDNNRDFFASTQAETENINRVLYWQWFPQILYNHHQSGPAGTIVYSPPLRDPYNYNLDPGIIVGLQSVGAAMNTRLVMEGKGGLTQRTGASYDGWWNGGIRNTATFHNTIALLTEMIGGPTPQRVPLLLPRQIPQADLALPIAPQPWRFRQSVDYSIELNRAVLNYASRNREDLLYNIHRMGRNSIERGSRDHWTANPRRDAAIAARSGSGSGVAGGGRGRGGASPAADSALWSAMRDPALRDARGYIISASQPDFGTATKFVNALRETGITVHRATAPFHVRGKPYPAGSFVVKTNQAFRPHVLDMFEPQMHPDVIPYPGASPTPPYDIAGWTLAYQMGVEFDRILDGFDGPFEPVTDWNVSPSTTLAFNSAMTGFTIDRRSNDAFTAANRLMKAGTVVHRLPNGDFLVRANDRSAIRFGDPNGVLKGLGVTLQAVSGPVPAGARQLTPARVGLWDVYGGSMDAGWARWILEQFEFPFERVFAPALDAGNLNAKFDALVFVDGSLPAAGGTGGGRGGAAGGGRGGAGATPQNIPAEYQSHVGRVTPEATYPKLREFMENGGTIVAIGQSGMNLAEWLKLPVGSHLVDANGAALPTTKFYVPGSVLMARVDTTHALARGMRPVTAFFFERSPVFRILPGGESTVERIAWFDSATPLASGWALGQENLQGGIAALRAKVGKGALVLYGPEILQRAQPHGTFKLLFNAIH
ncbi:MAG TPA: M14 metallopeptidase family protein [Gemmatimonadaceae bacterium]|nr:M14 metallopeptidase family protein [Gemmatimonadaceae bacterium]